MIREESPLEVVHQHKDLIIVPHHSHDVLPIHSKLVPLLVDNLFDSRPEIRAHDILMLLETRQLRSEAQQFLIKITLYLPLYSLLALPQHRVVGLRHD